MKIVGVTVDWHDGFHNEPSFKVQVDEPLPKDMVYRSLDLDSMNSPLSREQMAVVSPPKRTGVKEEILYAEDASGYVRFVKVGKDTGYPRGGLAGTYRMDDGTERHIRSGWMVASAVVNNNPDLPEICECSFVTPEYRNVAMAAFIRMDVLREAFDRCMPEVEIIPTIHDMYTARIKGKETKETFLKIKEVDLDVAKAKVAHDLGVDISDRKVWYEYFKQILDDPRCAKITKKEYSDYLGQEFIVVDSGLQCSLCGWVEMPDKRQESIMQSWRQQKKDPWEYFRNWCEHYHCCKEHAVY